MKKPLTRKADKPLFPTTLDMLRPKAMQGVPCVHLVAEYRGMRFYLGTFETISDCHYGKDAYKPMVEGQRVSWYILDRSATHFISGGEDEFLAELAKGQAQ